MNYTSLGEVVLQKFAAALDAYGIIEKKPKLEGKTMTMIMVPKQ